MVKLIRQDIAVTLSTDEARAIKYALGRMKPSDWKGNNASLADVGTGVFEFFNDYFDPI